MDPYFALKERNKAQNVVRRRTAPPLSLLSMATIADFQTRIEKVLGQPFPHAAVAAFLNVLVPCRPGLATATPATKTSVQKFLKGTIAAPPWALRLAHHPEWYSAAVLECLYLHWHLDKRLGPAAPWGDWQDMPFTTVELLPAVVLTDEKLAQWAATAQAQPHDAIIM
jgi:hypothetical protein